MWKLWRLTFNVMLGTQLERTTNFALRGDKMSRENSSYGTQYRRNYKTADEVVYFLLICWLQWIIQEHIILYVLYYNFTYVHLLYYKFTDIHLHSGASTQINKQINYVFFIRVTDSRVTITNFKVKSNFIY